MPSAKRYQELLEEIKEAHAEFRSAVKTVRAKLAPHEKASASEATKKELEAFNNKLKLLGTALGSLKEPFLAGSPTAVNEVLSFLEADVPAFGAGYKKEWYYGKLKGLKLNSDQLEKLKEIAVKRCASPEYRREDGELRRLMIHVADIDFLRKIAELPEKSNPHVKRKKSLMQQVVLRGRKDLRKQVEATLEPN